MAPPDEALTAYRVALGAARRWIVKCPAWAKDDIVSDALLGAVYALRGHDPERGPLAPYVIACADSRIHQGVRVRGGMKRGGLSEPEQRRGVTLADLPSWRQLPAHIDGFEDVHEFLVEAFAHCEDPASQVIRRVDLERSMVDLTLREQQAIAMTLLGFNQPEVGEHLGASRAGIKQSLKYAYNKMRPLLVTTG